jgi:tryptophanyl-tRNA synthetase
MSYETVGHFERLRLPERRAELERNPRIVEEVLAAGSARARAEANETLRMIKAAMGLNFIS